MILYLRVVPGFWIAVEELRRPELQSRPLIIGGLPHQRGLVHEANIPAQRYGVHAGMTLSQAHQHCPEGIFLVPDLPSYEAAWQTVCGVLRTYTPLVEPLEMGQAVCDLSGSPISGGPLRTGFGDMARTIASEIRRATGIAPWLGVASNRLVAQLASTTVGADGISVIERGQERAFLATLPIVLLPDVDERLALTFQVLGLRTIGQFAALPASSVKQRFGVAGEKLHRYAQGIDSRSVVPPPPEPSVAARYECEDGDFEEALAAIHRLAGACADELQRRRLAGRLVELKLEPFTPQPPLPHGERGRLADMGGNKSFSLSPEKGLEREGFSIFTASIAVRTAIDTVSPLLGQVQRLLVQSWPRDPSHPRLRAIELKVSEFEAPAQLSFAEFNRRQQTGMLRGMDVERLRALAELERLLAARHGETPFRHVTSVDPDNSVAERRFRWQAGRRA